MGNKNKASITPPTTKPNEKKMKEYISIYQNVTPTPKKEIESNKADNDDQNENHETSIISPTKSDCNITKATTKLTTTPKSSTSNNNNKSNNKKKKKNKCSTLTKSNEKEE